MRILLFRVLYQGPLFSETPRCVLAGLNVFFMSLVFPYGAKAAKHDRCVHITKQSSKLYVHANFTSVGHMFPQVQYIRRSVVYIYIDVYCHPPKIYTRLFHTILQVASLHWPTTHLCRKHSKYRYNRAFRHVHANRAATSSGFDICINLAPNLGRRFIIVYVLDKLKCWRARYFCSCRTKKPRVFALYSALWCVY